MDPDLTRKGSPCQFCTSNNIRKGKEKCKERENLEGKKTRASVGVAREYFLSELASIRY